jgi:hypothetical protein
MHCREFRDKHVAFVDDLLPAFEMNAMRQHLTICSGCARQDVKVRRSLLLVRNLPPIEVSPDFMQRLNARLAEVGSVPRDDFVRARSIPSFMSVAALAAGVAAVAYLALETNNYFAHPDDFAATATPMVAAAPAPMPEPIEAQISSAALVAAVPTGIPMWPTVLMVGQTPTRLASMGFSDEQTR